MGAIVVHAGCGLLDSRSAGGYSDTTQFTASSQSGATGINSDTSETSAPSGQTTGVHEDADSSSTGVDVGTSTSQGSTNGGSAAASEGGDELHDSADVEDDASTAAMETGHCDPPEVLLVVDKSASMFQAVLADGGKEVTRWAALHRVLSQVLPRHETALDLGMYYFPVLDPSEDGALRCQVDSIVHVEIGREQAENILEVLPGPDSYHEGDTPTYAALFRAVQYMESRPADRRRVIVMILDGATNCAQSNMQVVTAAGQALEAGIRVHLLGVDLSPGAAQALNAVATAGGTTALVNSNDGAMLERATDGLLSELGECSL